MARQDASCFDAKDVAFLDHGNGTSAMVHLHGGTLISWKCRGIENVFLSEKAVFGEERPIKGGAPISFPHFGPWDLGPMHGFANFKRWSLQQPPTKEENGDVVALLQLTDDVHTRQMWDFKFKLVQKFTLTEDCLTTQFSYHNEDDKSWSFTSCVHTFFRVAHVSTASLTGLKDAIYVKTFEDAETTDSDDAIKVDDYIARVYRSVKSPVQLTSGPEPGRNVELTTQNFANIVLWNPWIEMSKDFPDLHPDGYKQFVCVESGNIREPITVQPGTAYECSHVFRAVSTESK